MFREDSLTLSRIARSNKSQIIPAGLYSEKSSAWLSRELLTRKANHNMRRFRSVPVARRAWFVTLTATEVTRESFAKGQLVQGTEFRPQQFWVHARRVARTLVAADRKSGGNGSAFPVEYRHCKVCSRVLLAAAARAYRELERWPMATWKYHQGPPCSLECKPIIIRNSKNRRKEVA